MELTLPLGADLIVFDGTCIFCSDFARFMARRDRSGQFRFVTAQSPLGRALYLHHGLDPDLIDRKSTRLNSSHRNTSRMPSSA